MRRAALPLLIVPALLLAACGGGDEAGPTDSAGGGARPTVVVTTTILGDLVGAVAGELVEVEVLLPAGADPHDWEPSARDAARMAEADLVVANGLGLEAGLEPVLEQLEADGVAVLEVAPELSPIPFGEHGSEVEDDDHADEAEDDDGHGHDEGGLDPHVWMDPDRMGAAAALVAEVVADRTGVDAATLAANAAAYDERLRAADEEVQAALAAVPQDRRVLVTSHDTLGYFAERYGFEVVGVVIPGGSTLAEPGAGDLAELVEVVRSTGAPAVFAETTVDPELAEALAAEAGGGVEVVTLFSGSLGPAGSGAETLPDLLVTNATRIADALSG